MLIGAANDPNQSLAEEIRRIASEGFAFVDLQMAPPGAALENTDWKSVRAQLEQARLMAVCRAPDYLPIDNPSPIVRQAALDELRRCIDAAGALGASLLTTIFRGWPPYLAEESGYDYLRQYLNILVAHGRPQGVAVALENSADNRRQLKHFREIYRRLPELKLAYDIGNGNIQTAKSMTRDYLFAFADKLAHVRISDNDGAQPSYLPFGAPESGGIDIARELRSLSGFGYDGSITLEIRGDRRWLIACRTMLVELWQQSA
jgi:sugar phosphate isomerase/epimerase